ncbi:hypothetical protein [Mycobacterium shimoidei]|uniref:Uncharacterized protein n=1 Tax=Mycobacterium shimoidei TaxID=29313 RepID=A0A375YXQ6_MYCSH|nr:hypothetical protein [Mycobacterium shimoidei]MCV7261070.1 hypothetical protein [Mycobacterium shimoidei]SRX93668.1 hypothetical protein MSP7336_01911 [Mycobacterium shimoidei]
MPDSAHWAHSPEEIIRYAKDPETKIATITVDRKFPPEFRLSKSSREEDE